MKMTYDKFLRMTEPFDYFVNGAVETTNEIFEKASIDVVTVALASNSSLLIWAICVGPELLNLIYSVVKRNG